MTELNKGPTYLFDVTDQVNINPSQYTDRNGDYILVFVINGKYPVLYTLGPPTEIKKWSVIVYTSRVQLYTLMTTFVEPKHSVDHRFWVTV